MDADGIVAARWARCGAKGSVTLADTYEMVYPTLRSNVVAVSDDGKVALRARDSRTVVVVQLADPEASLAAAVGDDVVPATILRECVACFGCVGDIVCRGFF